MFEVTSLTATKGWHGWDKPFLYHFGSKSHVFLPPLNYLGGVAGSNGWSSGTTHGS